MDYLIFILLAPVAALLSVFVGHYAWRRREIPEARALALHMLAITGWLLAYVAELLTRSEAATLFFDQLGYLPTLIVPLTGYAFACHFSGRPAWASRHWLGIIALAPLLTLILVFSNGQHHLIWRSYYFVRSGPFLTMQVHAYGPAFWLYAAYAYSLTLITTGLLLSVFLRPVGIYRRQAGWVLLGSLLPLGANLVYVYRLIPGLHQDFSPVSLALGGIFFAVGIFRERLFGLRPVARNLLVDQMRDAMIVIDRSHSIVDVNPAALAIAGLRADQLIGQPVTRLLPDLLLPDVTEGCCTHPADQQFTLEVGGEQRIYEMHMVPLLRSALHQPGALITLHNITEHIRLVQELDSFAHSVAHDLKNPMTIIAGNAYLLLESPEGTFDKETQRQFEHMVMAVDKMDAITNSLLLLASVRRQQSLPLARLEMGPIVREALGQIYVLIYQSGAQVIQPEGWPAALGYGPWVEELWVNYLSNAVKYGGRPPCIELGAEAPRDGMVTYWVRDNGAGLNPAEASKLFVPFTRLGQVDATGHGLGLSIVQRIAERLGGAVGVESAPGRGSRFWFRLPEATE